MKRAKQTEEVPLEPRGQEERGQAGTSCMSMFGLDKEGILLKHSSGTEGGLGGKGGVSELLTPEGLEGVRVVVEW